MGAGGIANFDRSLDVRIRLWDEASVWPAVVVGLMDMGGTGIYSSEYVVASKRFGDVDFSVGLGCGRLGSSGMLTSPFALLSDRFRDRPLDVGQGGTFSGASFFHGEDVSFLGSVIWDTPILNRTARAEYSREDYAFKQELSGFPC